MTQFFGELLGTFILVSFGLGSIAGVVLNKSKAKSGGWLGISLGFGLGLAIAIYIVGDMSGAHVNPAVTLAMALIGNLPWIQVPIYLVAQLLGAIAGALIVYLHYFPHWKETEDKQAKLSVFVTGSDIRNNKASFLSEVIGTFFLVFGILVIANADINESLKPLIIGLLLTSIAISMGGTTGFALNPARDLGPRIIHAILPIPEKRNSDWGYSWVPLFAPIVGGAIAAVLYILLF
jgi:glycerol uptake facilitator protein